MTPADAVRYNQTAVHFYVAKLPRLLRESLPPGPLALADIGCGDGPLFPALVKGGHISASTPAYAVDLEAARLKKVSDAFPFVKMIVSGGDEIPRIREQSLDFAISTMVLEHVPDEVKFLSEIRRVLKPGALAYITTVYKKKWAWYFRKRNGGSVLDVSHLREYTDLAAFKTLMESAGLDIVRLETELLWFPFIDPIAFRLFRNNNAAFHNPILRFLRCFKAPILGYYSLNVIVKRNSSTRA